MSCGRGGQVEVLEQPAGDLREGRLVVDGQREGVELGAGLLLDPWGDQIEPGAQQMVGGASPVSRWRASRPIAVESGTSSALRARRIASPRTRASVSSRKIFADAVHHAGAESLEPRRLQSIEHGARVGVERRASGMEPVVVMPQAKSQRIGGASASATSRG